MNLLNLKTAAVAIAAAALTGTSTYLVKENEVDRLRAQQTTMAGDFSQLGVEREQAMALVQTRDNQIQRLKQDVADIPRLRGEVDRLNRSLADLQKLTDENIQLRAAIEELKDATLVENQIPGVVPPGKIITRELLSYVGYDTPEAAFQTAYWAVVNGNLDEVLNFLAAPDRLKLVPNDVEEFEKAIQVIGPLFQGLQMLGRKNIDPDHIELKIRRILDTSEGPLPPIFDQDENDPGISIETMVRENGQWKNKPIEAPLIPSVADWSQSGDIVHYAN